MADLVPEYLTFDYRCRYRGIPGAHHDPEDYPMVWTVKVKGTVWDDDDDDGGDGKEVTVGAAQLYMVPDAGNHRPVLHPGRREPRSGQRS